MFTNSKKAFKKFNKKKKKIVLQIFKVVKQNMTFVLKKKTLKS